jgi:hypothetical protein
MPTRRASWRRRADLRRAAAARISNQSAADLNGQPPGEVIPFEKP